MTDELAILATIIAKPDDDSPRLIYADWLEENGEVERAEFVRLQVEAARRDGNHASAMPLWELLHSSKDWFAEALKAVRLEWDDWGIRPDGSVNYESKHHGQSVIVRRGFIAEVHCTLAQWRGGECGRCDGTGVTNIYTRDGDYEASDCWDCPAGIGKRLAASHSIEVVEVTDKRPFQAQWFRGQNRLQLDPESDLPEELFDRLDGHLLEIGEAYGQALKEYRTEADARAALSRALIEEARQP